MQLKLMNRRHNNVYAICSVWNAYTCAVAILFSHDFDPKNLNIEICLKRIAMCSLNFNDYFFLVASVSFFGVVYGMDEIAFQQSFVHHLRMRKV